MQLTSGQVMLYNTKTRKTIHLTEVAHTKQIQEVRISNLNSSLMSSVSFDGSLRVWDLRSNSLRSMFEDRQA